MHGVAIRKVPLTTSDVIEMVHFAAPDTRLVRWCSRAYCVLACSLSRGDENQIKEAFINGGRGHPPSHLKFFLLVFSKLKEDIK